MYDKIPSAEKVFKEVLAAADRIKPCVQTTPVLTSDTINNLVGKQVYFKCENFQTTGSFKIRGAMNAVMKLKDLDPNVSGVVTRSSGNHGMGVAKAAWCSGLKSAVVVRHGTPAVKCNAIRGYQSDLVFCEPTPAASIAKVAEIERKTGYQLISSFENDDVLYGQGTVGLELFNQVKDLDAVFIPTCGGSLAASTAVVAKYRSPRTRVYAVEPCGKGLEDCLRQGRVHWPNPPNYIDTIAEAIQLQYIAKQNFPLLREYAEKEVFAVTDEEIVNAMILLFQRMKLVVEPGGAAGLAAALSQRMRNLCGPEVKKIGVILTGGNVDLDHLPWLQHEQQEF